MVITRTVMWLEVFGLILKLRLNLMRDGIILGVEKARVTNEEIVFAISTKGDQDISIEA